MALKRYRKLSGLGAQSNPLETSAALPLGHGEGQELKASLQWLSIHLMSNSSNSSSYNNNSYNNNSYNSSNYNSSFLSNGSAVGALNGSEKAVEAEEMEQWEGGRGEEEEALWRDVDYFFGAYTLYEILDPYGKSASCCECILLETNMLICFAFMLICCFAGHRVIVCT